jgi:hypothetical protein
MIISSPSPPHSRWSYCSGKKQTPHYSIGSTVRDIDILPTCIPTLWRFFFEILNTRRMTKSRKSHQKHSSLQIIKIMFFLWLCDPTRVMTSSFLKFLDHTQRRTAVGRTPLDEWSALRRDLYLTTHNTTDKHPCPRWDSNPRFQKASGRRPTP